MCVNAFNIGFCLKNIITSDTWCDAQFHWLSVIFYSPGGEHGIATHEYSNVAIAVGVSILNSPISTYIIFDTDSYHLSIINHQS